MFKAQIGLEGVQFYDDSMMQWPIWSLDQNKGAGNVIWRVAVKERARE